MDPTIDLAAARSGAPRRSNRAARVRVFVGTLLILTAVLVLVMRARKDSVVYYVTVSELLASKGAGQPKGLRVTGKVVPGTIRRTGRELAFRVTDGVAAVPVDYEGVVPETFDEGSEVVVEGRYAEDGVFHANGLLTKCPSKYEAAEKEGARHPEGIPKRSF